MEVRAQRVINKGDEITTRYLAPSEGQPRRQEKIVRNWRFICDCTRCKDPSDLATFYSAIKCQKCLNKLGDVDCNQGSTNGILTNTSAYNDGYLLPDNVQMLGTPWLCNACGFKQGQRETEEVLKSLEISLVEIKSEANEAVKSNEFAKLVDHVKMSIDRLNTKVHPNHFLLFQFKVWFIQLRLPDHLSLSKVHHDISNGINVDLSSQILFLELQMEYSIDLLRIVETLDPGLTINRAGHLKNLAKCRMELSRFKMLDSPATYTKLQHMLQMKLGMAELKQVSLSFRFPENNR